MENKKAFILYYLLPFFTYILFAALQSYNPRTFWGLIAMGMLFAFMGLFLMQRSLRSSRVVSEDLLPEEPVPALASGPDGRDDRISVLESSLKSRDEELAHLRQQADTVQNHLTQQTELIKQKDAIIQELRFEVKSLVSVKSRGDG